MVYEGYFALRVETKASSCLSTSTRSERICSAGLVDYFLQLLQREVQRSIWLS